MTEPPLCYRAWSQAQPAGWRSVCRLYRRGVSDAGRPRQRAESRECPKKAPPDDTTSLCVTCRAPMPIASRIGLAPGVCLPCRARPCRSHRAPDSHRACSPLVARPMPIASRIGLAPAVSLRRTCGQRV